MTSLRAPRVVGRDPLPAAAAGAWPPGAPETWLLSVSRYISAMDEGAPGKILDGEERERAARFVRTEDQQRYTAAHLGLRELLGAYLDLEPAAVPFTREDCPGCGGPHGRPAVVGTPLHFNMSHAGDLVLFAFAGSPIGADVEKVQPASVVAQVAQSLHPTERAELTALAEADRPAAFARCWTRKEAYLKGIGTGLSQDPAIAYVGTGERPVPVGPWTLTDLPADHLATAAADSGSADGPGYAAAYALLEKAS
ncbi:4'-phosphopantetheinyl transferase family protein [Streptomyces sp. ME19-01-6]|uniref:4'-phosphopantetheinyl transferase family protein n=1 Tax=Streptomyces sp. ME19-01-6 TaxID=3028686 RepID=UPI0029A772A8|nr:4'-phosphopantetheinyl transferase superfamily protein [Streptomyces sp. ME19-01-6]MDX3228813.1 4'-phosphopantetheinyl transferase superfamily protein [Streptomyces sp. ME19-01-6]